MITHVHTHTHMSPTHTQLVLMSPQTGISVLKASNVRHTRASIGATQGLLEQLLALTNTLTLFTLHHRQHATVTSMTYLHVFNRLKVQYSVLISVCYALTTQGKYLIEKLISLLIRGNIMAGYVLAKSRHRSL